MAVQILGSGPTMFPGTYRTNFDPAMTLTIDHLVDLDCAAGYECRGDIDVNLPQWVAFEFGNVHGSELDVMRLDKVHASVTDQTLVDPPDDLATWLAGQPGMKQLAEPVSVTIGGISGVRLNLRADRNVTYGPIGLAEPADITDFGIGAGSRLWITVVRVQGHWVLISEVLGPDNTVRDFDAAIRGLEPIVDSIVWS
jgi:hypothetical protein